MYTSHIASYNLSSMDQFLLEVFKTGGISALSLAAVGWYVYALTKQHREERKEWRDDQSKAIERRDVIAKESNEVLRQLTSVIERVNKK